VYAVTTADATQYCTNVLSTSDTAGSPVIFGGGATADVIVTAGNAVGAFTTSFTAGHTCPPHGSMSFSNPSPPPPSSQPTLGPPSADGSTVFFGYDNNTFTTGDRGLKSVHFAGGTFDTANTVNIGKLPTNSSGPAPIALSSDLFFGNDFNHQFYDYTTALTLSHTSPTLTAAIFASPVISGGLVFGASDQLLAFNKSDISTTAWTAVSGGTQVTPPAIGVDTLYVSAAANKLIHAIDAVTGTTTRSDRWTYGGSGATTPVTTLSSVTTEPTLAADGTLYFGDSGGKVYALITDTVPATTGAGDWPRTGFDNCNSNHSNNTGFSCQ
jgi:hypothetical protein